MEEPIVGEWARTKLAFLSDYLAAYTTILRKYDFRYVYIDAFAGAGRARVRGADASPRHYSLFEDKSDAEQQQYLDGSPKTALAVEPPFSQYVFVELDPERVAFLEQLKVEYGDARDILIRQEDCNAYLLRTIPKVDWRRYRAVVFLDPFGMQVPWSTVEALAKTRAVEVFINFPVGMSIQRMLKRTGEFTENERAKLDGYFGTAEWYDVLYHESPSLFGPMRNKATGSGAALVKWYRQRLEDVFGFASKARLIRNSNGGHLYYLIFAGPKAAGAKIADHLLSAGEVVG